MFINFLSLDFKLGRIVKAAKARVAMRVVRPSELLTALHWANILRTMTRYIGVALLFISFPALAETYTVDREAWTCEGFAAIKEVEELAKRGDKERLQHVSAVAQCRKAAIPRGVLTGEDVLTPPGDQIVNRPVTVMYAADTLAFVCEQHMDCGGNIATFYCGYALLSDMRDSNGKPASLQQLQKEAHGKTMADIPNSCPGCGCLH
jgi:hypothetical protein